MKTTNGDQPSPGFGTAGMWQVTSDKMRPPAREARSRHVSRFTFHASAFTLIELLVVIAIMGVLAALLLPVVAAVKKHQYIYNTQTQMAQLETAIDRYKAAYGFYPPSPTNPPTAGKQSTLVNQLYYELVGTVLTNGGALYLTLDGSASIDVGQVPNAFTGIGGFVNCTKPGGDEDASAARNFLPDLKPKQFWPQPGYTNPPATEGVNLFICSVGGPDATYQPLGQQDRNPWRYNSSSPTNNPGSYDLWVQLVIGKQTNLICNWTKQVQINSPLP
jgi:prepilin-type N-terminal cleavage/methylation domain-containing protein